MSARTPAQRGITPPRLPSNATVFDGLWRDLLDRMDALGETYATTMGTVLSVSGGKVRVQVDDENKPRGIGFPRAKGVAYSVGDRVVLHRTKGGAWIVGGIISDGSSDGSVGHAQITPGAIDTSNLTSDLSTKINSIDNKVGQAYVDSAISDLQSQIKAINKDRDDLVSTYNANFKDIGFRICKLERKAFGSPQGSGSCYQ